MLQVCVLKEGLRDRCLFTPGVFLKEGVPFEESFFSRFLHNAKFVFSKRVVLKSKRLGKGTVENIRLSVLCQRR